MISVIKVGDLIYENIEPYYTDENGNQIWNIPTDPNELREAYKGTLVWLAKQRLGRILDQYGYNGLADVKLYAEQNDTEAQALLKWYQAYDDEIWNWIDTELPNYQTVNDLLQLDMEAVEEQAFQNSIQAAPLP